MGELLVHLLTLAVQCGVFLPINSGYRSPDHNAKVGGVPHSLHQLAEAFDLSIAHLSRPQVSCLTKTAAEKRINFVVYKKHLHIDTKTYYNSGFLDRPALDCSNLSKGSYSNFLYSGHIPQSFKQCSEQ